MSKGRVAIAFALFMAENVSGQDLAPGAIASPGPQPAGATAEVERVIGGMRYSSKGGRQTINVTKRFARATMFMSKHQVTKQNCMT